MTKSMWLPDLDPIHVGLPKLLKLEVHDFLMSLYADALPFITGTKGPKHKMFQFDNAPCTKQCP